MLLARVATSSQNKKKLSSSDSAPNLASILMTAGGRFLPREQPSAKSEVGEWEMEPGAGSEGESEHGPSQHQEAHEVRGLQPPTL